MQTSGLRVYQVENNGSDPQETGCQVTDHQLVFLNCDTAVSRCFLERLGLVSVLKVECLVSVLRVWEDGTSRSRLGLEGSTSRSCDLTSCGHPWLVVWLGSVIVFLHFEPLVYDKTAQNLEHCHLPQWLSVSLLHCNA